MICGNYKIRTCEKHGRFFVAEGKPSICPQCKIEIENDKTKRSSK